MKRIILRAVLITALLVGAFSFNLDIIGDVVEASTDITRVRGVKVVRHGNSALKLRWNEQDIAKGYEIFKYNNEKKKYIKTKTLSKSVWIDRSIDTNEVGRYRVRAYTQSGGKKKHGRFSYSVRAKAYDRAATTTNASKNIELSDKKLTLGVTHRHKLKATVKPYTKISKNAKMPLSKTIRWYSSNKKVATVSKNGVVRGKGEGKCYIRAVTHNGRNKKISVNVTDYSRPTTFTLFQGNGADNTIEILGRNIEDVGDIAVYFRGYRPKLKKPAYIHYDPATDSIKVDPASVKVSSDVGEKLKKLTLEAPGLFLEVTEDYISFMNLVDETSYNEVIHMFDSDYYPIDNYSSYKLAPYWYFEITDNI
jgi:hypothetical protein